MYATQGLLVAITAQLLLFEVVHSGALSSSEDSLAEPLEAYLQEVRDQQASSTCVPSAISHGDTVAFQSFKTCNPSYWLSCESGPCVTTNRPGTTMTNWGCWRVVFQLYRQGGPGTIIVGDRVGVHFPHQSVAWLGCAGSTHQCGLGSCPGVPTSTYGFKDSSSWNGCWGESFHIYAMGKSVGNPIIEGDIVMLYYTNGKKWVALNPGGNIGLSPCPGSGRPPPLSRYESCSESAIKIWKKSP